MKSKIFIKIAKNIQVTILAIAIIVSSIQFSGVTEVKADDAAFEASISGFPESYKPYLRQLHATYPNWTFQPFNTGIDFGTAVDNEASNDRSLTHTNYSEFLQSNASGDYNIATGKYIAFCEGDDYWIDSHKLQKQVAYLETHPNVGCVYTDFNRLWQANGFLECSVFHTNSKWFPLHSDLATFVCTPSYLAPCTWMFRKELLVKPSFESVDSTFVLFAHMLSKTDIYFLPDTTSVYRLLPESASHSNSLEKTYMRVSGLYTAQMELVKLYNLPMNIKEEIDEKYYLTYLRLLAAFGDKDVIIEMRRALRGKRLSFYQYFRLQVARTQLGRKIIRILYKFYFHI